MQAAARLQNPLTLDGELRREYPALEMALLPPRIGKIDMHCLARIRGDKVAQEQARVRPGQTHVGQAALGHSGGGKQLVFALGLDAEEIDVRPRLRRSEEKQALAEAHFDLHRM